jgi:hypothetical protein
LHEYSSEVKRNIRTYLTKYYVLGFRFDFLPRTQRSGGDFEMDFSEVRLMAERANS